MLTSERQTRTNRDCRCDAGGGEAAVAQPCAKLLPTHDTSPTSQVRSRCCTYRLPREARFARPEELLR